MIVGPIEIINIDTRVINEAERSGDWEMPQRIKKINPKRERRGCINVASAKLVAAITRFAFINFLDFNLEYRNNAAVEMSTKDEVGDS